MEKIQILGEIVDNRSFVKMPKGKRNRNNKNRNKNKEKQQQNVQQHNSGVNQKKNASLYVKTSGSTFNYAENVPTEIWMKIFSFCDQVSLDNLKMTCVAFYNIIDSNAAQYANLESNNTNNGSNFANMPSEIILTVFNHLNQSDLARCARVCRRFRDLTTADCLWMGKAKESLATNCQDSEMKSKSVQPWISAQDRVRISQNWVRGHYAEMQLIVQDIRYMPRIQLDAETIWVSWGAQVWAHPRRSDGTVCRTASQLLRGHSDDVSRFVVRDGLVVSGGRDKTLVGWRQYGGRHYEFAFAKRYCHGSEVSAVDVADKGSIVISGSRDQLVKVWRLADDDFLSPISTINIGDRIWSLATSKAGCVAVGSAGLYGIPSLTLLDLATGVRQDIGAGLRKGAGMLDLNWIDETKLLSCGYDSYARLWDIRSGTCVRKWEEPFNEAIYCMSTDNNMTLVCGTARHGLVRLWDMRHTQPVQMYHIKHPRIGQSSPVYSVSFDQSNLYVALDQCLSLVSFVNPTCTSQKTNNYNNKVVYYR